MPPIRTMPAVKPVRTERTHEENQERAYIAASRRSDRSLEARVESARRASEIHKKRTGRSLRVREEDVMNEEMYEEEDDDLPMQFRRINALHPGLAYSAFNERVNNYLAGQIGVRNYLHQAIYQANQSAYSNHFLNPMMQHNALQNGTMSPQAMSGSMGNNPQLPFQMQNAQGMHLNSHARSASIATPQQFANHQQSPHPEMPHPDTPVNMNDRRQSLPPQNSISSPAASHPSTPHAKIQKKAAQSPQMSQSAQAQLPQGMRSHASIPPMAGSELNAQTYPLTTELPIETQQLLHGTGAYSNALFASQTTQNGLTPSSYNYNPNCKSTKRKIDSPQDDQSGLNQMLPQFAMHRSQSSSNLYPEPMSAASAPGNPDFNFNNDMFNNEMADFGDSNYFNMQFGSGSNNSGHVTPNDSLDVSWNHEEFFNYSAASD